MRRKHVLAAAVLVLGLLTACDKGLPLLGPDADQGIEGVVLLGPLCPVSVQDPCPDLPYQATLQVRDSGGRTVASVESGEDGRFRIGLEPGSYRLHPVSGNPLPVAQDQNVEVVSGQWTEVTVNYDTGIR